MRIFLATFTPQITELTKLNLSRKTITCDHYNDYEEAFFMLDSNINSYSVGILEDEEKKFDSIKFLKDVRQSKIHIPFIIFLKDNDVTKKVMYLDSGADDYMNWPVETIELISKINAILRRSMGHSDSKISIKDLIVDISEHKSEILGKDLKLTKKEQAILELMAIRKGRYISKENLLNHLYNGIDEPEGKVIDVFVCKIRKKMIEASGGIDYIDTSWGKGYALIEPQIAS